MKFKIFIALFLGCFQFAFSQWTDLNTGINDNLSGVVFLQNNGMVSGSNGLYYTTTGGEGAASWTRFQITDNAADSDIYENTTFKHCFSDPSNSYSSGYVYACGQNRVTQEAVVIRIALPSLAYSIVYVGEANTSLNKIGCYNNRYYAVGDDGLFVKMLNTQVQAVTSISNDDLSSISFSNNKCVVSTNGKLLYCTPFSSFDTTFAFVETLTPASNNKDIDITSVGNYTFSIGDKYAAYYSSSPRAEYANYDFGPINGSAVMYYSNSAYVGTDHGIFKASGDYKVLEWQPSSLSHSINEFWNLSSSNNPIYACGTNGLLLKSTNGGGVVKPYVKITGEGGCVNENSILTVVKGYTTSCSWYINGQLVQSFCSNLGYNLSAVGSYNVSVTVQNGYGLQSTDTKTITIVAKPLINKPVTISDNVLCHSETIQVQIENSEPNVVYTLKKDLGGDTFGSSGVGNGGTISFTSAPISASGSYFLQAKNILGECAANFSDVIPIVVEQTKSDFHTDLINAKTNEVVNFYGKVAEAQNYQWTFSPNGNSPSTTSLNTAASFSSPGATNVTLDVWSNNGCSDQKQKPGAYIYEEPSNPDNCWTMVNRGTDSPWNGFSYEGTTDLKPTTDGFIACGSYNDQIFDSKIGVAYDLRNKKGCFLTKHDKNGALKWMVYTEHTPFFNDNRDDMFSTVVDQLGNIYVCGLSAGNFIDNRGNKYTTNLGGAGSSSSGFIIKLDSKGNLLWLLNSNNFGPSKLYIDKENNLIATGGVGPYYEPNLQLYLNGVASDVINQPMIGSQTSNCSMIKFSPSGSVIWHTGINIRNVNGADLTGIGFDANNNIYILGMYEFDADFYSVGSATPTVLPRYSDYGGRQFLVKYNQNGILQWKTRSIVVNGFDDDVYPYSLVTDDAGNSYITGRNRCVSASGIHNFENSDGTVYGNSVGAFYFMKVNPQGICQWIRGDKHTSYSAGEKIIKQGNNIHIAGVLSNNNGSSATSEFVSSDLQNYTLTANYVDIFIATYDLNGNLKRITLNGENTTARVPQTSLTGFFKGDGDSFYLARNFGYVTNYTNFGDMLSIDDVDGTISRFNENCGIIKYDTMLGEDDFTLATQGSVYPNPTTGDFTIDLGENLGEVTVEITDVLGKVIQNKKMNGVNQIQASIKGVEGLYFVKVYNGNKVSWYKLLKK